MNSTPKRSRCSSMNAIISFVGANDILSMWFAAFARVWAGTNLYGNGMPYSCGNEYRRNPRIERCYLSTARNGGLRDLTPRLLVRAATPGSVDVRQLDRGR